MIVVLLLVVFCYFGFAILFLLFSFFSFYGIIIIAFIVTFIKCVCPTEMICISGVSFSVPVQSFLLLKSFIQTRVLYIYCKGKFRLL